MGCAHVNDKYIWLENLDSSESKAWVSNANEQSNIYFSKNKYFENDKKDYESIVLADVLIIHVCTPHNYLNPN